MNENSFLSQDATGHSPSVHGRPLRLDYRSRTVGLDPSELGRFLLGSGMLTRDNALCSLVLMDELRISEALGADADQLGFEDDHDVLTSRRESGETLTIALASYTAWSLDLAIGYRRVGPLPRFQR